MGVAHSMSNNIPPQLNALITVLTWECAAQEKREARERLFFETVIQPQIDIWAHTIREQMRKVKTPYLKMYVRELSHYHMKNYLQSQIDDYRKRINGRGH